MMLTLLLVFFESSRARNSGAFDRKLAAQRTAENKWMLDRGLVKAMNLMFLDQEVASVCDAGAGGGHYAHALRVAGNNSYVVYAFDAYDDVATITRGQVQFFDLSQRAPMRFAFDWTYSIEVAEHIPREYETTFVENLANFSRAGIVCSWAHRSQGGIGHVNERSPEEVLALFARVGFYECTDYTVKLGRAASISWIKNNVHVFVRNLEEQC